MRLFLHVVRIIFGVLLDSLTFSWLCFRPTATVAAENLFLRKQLGLFLEREVKPRRATDSVRFTLARLSRWFDWRNALIVVKPDTLIRWHRKGFRLFWKWKSRSLGRPRVPAKLQKLIAEMASDNPTWGEQRIADELLLKIGIRISPRTVRRYMPKTPKRPADPTQRWMTFLRNQAQAIIASDFFVVVTATFQLVYVFVIMEVASRRVLHFNVTRHPTADWRLQQFRECITGEEEYRFTIHDRDRIYSRDLDAASKTLGLTVLKTPYKAPQANAICERWIGSARRECLDFMIPISEAHIRQSLKCWLEHYNRSRPHSRMVQKLKSCGLAVVEVQHSAKSLVFPHRAIGCDRSFRCYDEAVVESLMVSFQMVMRNEFSDRVSQGILAEENHLLQTTFFDRAYEPFRIRIQVRRPWRQLDGFDAGSHQ